MDYMSIIEIFQLSVVIGVAILILLVMIIVKFFQIAQNTNVVCQQNMEIIRLLKKHMETQSKKQG